MTERPVLAMACGAGVVEEFVAELQRAIDGLDADLFNRNFAHDVLWGSPFGAVVSGYDEIHSIHSQMFAAARAEGANADGSRYEIEHARLLAQDVAIA